MLLPLKSVHAFTYLPLIYLNGNKGFQFLFAVKGWWLFIKRLFTGSRALNSLFVFFLSFDHRKIIPSKQSIDNLWAVNVLKKTVLNLVSWTINVNVLGVTVLDQNHWITLQFCTIKQVYHILICEGVSAISCNNICSSTV